MDKIHSNFGDRPIYVVDGARTPFTRNRAGVKTLQAFVDAFEQMNAVLRTERPLEPFAAFAVAAA